MVQKILWPEIGARQGRVHATEKLENFEKSSINIPSPLFFTTTKPWPTTRRGENSIASDGSLSVCFYRLYKPCVF